MQPFKQMFLKLYTQRDHQNHRDHHDLQVGALAVTPLTNHRQFVRVIFLELSRFQQHRP